MSTTEITDVLTLAAVDRAVRHERSGTPRAAPTWAMYEHAGVSSRSRAGRCVRAQLDALDGSALIARQASRRRDVGTDGGRQAPSVASYARKVSCPSLAESPQHRAWREARAVAEQRIEGFWTALLDDVQRAHDLLDGPRVPGHPPSDVWFELGERLQQESRRLASATYCLSEWREPDDARADVDHHSDPGDRALDAKERAKRQARRAGRRNTRLWDSDPDLVYLGRAIRRERQRLGLSEAELARKVRGREASGREAGGRSSANRI